MTKEVNLQALDTLMELVKKSEKFWGVQQIDQLDNGAFTVIFKNGIQAMCSQHRLGNLLYFLGPLKEFKVNKVLVNSVTYKQAIV